MTNGINRIIDVFLDSSVLFAACGSLTGASHSIVSLAEMGLLNVHITPYVTMEVERNLHRRLPKGVPLLNQFLEKGTLILNNNPALEACKVWSHVIEEKDTPIVAAAVAINANYLLSFNTKDFTQQVAEACNINILTPGQFIQLSRKVLSAGLKQHPNA